jgi:anti-anti-sigma factor
MDDSAILVSQSAGVAYIRVIGRGSFKNARYVKLFSEKMLELGTSRLVVDMQLCTHMDSTFMGVLASLSIQARKRNIQPPRIVNASARVVELLHNLGIDRMLKIETDAVNLTQESFSQVPSSLSFHSKDEITQTMLEAHEALVDSDERNRLKFQDVISYLRDKLGVTTS